MKLSHPFSTFRRCFLATSGCLVGTSLLADEKAAERKPTIFQHACMTLPYSAFPLERAGGHQVGGF